MKQKSLVSLLFLLVAFAAFAQSSKTVLQGVVRDDTTKEPVYMVTAVVKELGLWSVCDEQGRFRIPGLAPGTYTVEFSMLGYETVQTEIVVKKDQAQLVKDVLMKPTSLALDEITVTAKEGGEMNSSSKIVKQTLEHIQPSSLKDVMQLLPGSVTENPNLTSVNALSIRDFSGNAANALGTALIVDGASLSNDANMQVLSNGTATNAQSTAGAGVDARQVSTDNIESVEVIRGVPSAEYGDMTSGAVVVKTKAGITPWEVRLKADPALKQVYVGKGFSLGDKKGVLNFDADYAMAYRDVRTVADAFDRINVQAGYSNTFAKKVTFNVKLRGNYAKASSQSDPDLFLDELEMQRDRGLRLNINGRWIVSKPWLTNIEYVASGSYTDQYSRNKTYLAAGRVAGTTSMEAGESIGFFTPYQYYADVEVFGAPIDAQAKVVANQLGVYGNVSNKVMLGLEYKLQGNTGKGKLFDTQLPPNPGKASFRERSFKSIPFLHRFTAFAEDKVKVAFGEPFLEVQAGVRASGLYAQGITDMARFVAVEPRLNGRFVLLNRKHGFRQLSLRGGWGISYKMPSMVYLYPELAYADRVSFSYNDIDANQFGLAIVTTQKQDTQNQSLKLQKSVNFEAGIDFDAGVVSGSLVYYNEHLTNGYTFLTQYVPMEYERYGYTWNNGAPKQTLIPSGKTPVYRNHGIYVDGIQQPSITDTTFMAYSIPVNGVTNNKWGVEYTLDFPEIKALNTIINVSGAYMNMSSYYTAQPHYLYGSTVNGRTFPYIGIYAGSTQSSNGSVREKCSANVRFITHIPQIAMVVTLTAQVVFMDRSRQTNTLDGISQVYCYDDNGTRLTGEAALQDTRHVKRVNPLYVMDRSGHVQPFTQAMEQDASYENLIVTTNTPTYYLMNGYPVYGLLNIRLTKEIKQWATVSFYANNFLNLKGRVNNSVTGYPQDKNIPIYFGAEVKITLK